MNNIDQIKTIKETIEIDENNEDNNKDKVNEDVKYYISNYTINKCINKFISFQNIKTKNNQVFELEIIIKNVVQDISPQIIAYFGLFIKTIPNLKITLCFSGNQIPRTIEKCRQYAIHAFFAFEMDVITIKYYDEINKKEIFTASSYLSRSNPKKYIVISKKFAPMIYVDESNYSIFFEKKKDNIKNKKIDLDIEIPKNKNLEETIYKIFRKHLENLSFNNLNKHTFCLKGLVFLSRLHFYRALNDAKILVIYIKCRNPWCI